MVVDTFFPSKLQDIEQRMKEIDPARYGLTRNYGDGAVTRLGPYISRGLLSTRRVYNHIMSLEMPWQESEKLVQELAWRDYWQQVWRVKGDLIHTDIKSEQQQVSHHEIPSAVLQARTGIEAVDEAIKQLYQTGYMHNHMRMYLASICCNIGRSHWLAPSRWMYAHLLDGDIASNQLSWQWVAGTCSKKKYYANQDNINQFFKGEQKHTFLDMEYDRFETLEVPAVLSETALDSLSLELPNSDGEATITDRDTLVYTYYNLDPYWHEEKDVQRVLLLEPSIFKRYKVSSKCLDFALNLAKNIPGIILLVGEYEELLQRVHADRISYKEHPLCGHYTGREEPREWLSSVEGDFPSFFSFWKKCKKELLQ